MKLAYLAFTEKGVQLADRLSACCAGTVTRCGGEVKLSDWVEKHFTRMDGLVFVGAVGIAVRGTAPYLRHKGQDPAVVVIDECGQFSVPILSGHLGGANELARKLAAVCGAIPVITTATDCNGVFAIDEWARKQSCCIPNPEKIKNISGALLAGGEIRMRAGWDIVGQPPKGVKLVEDKGYDVMLDIRTRGKDVLRLVPKIAVLGIGCRKNTSAEQLEEAFSSILGKSGIYPQAIVGAASIDMKREEAGLLEFCARHCLPITFYTANQLKQAEGNFTPSAFVQKITGVDNVCERSAVLASHGKLYQIKNAGNGVTMAIALKPYQPTWRWQDE